MSGREALKVRQERQRIAFENAIERKSIKSKNNFVLELLLKARHRVLGPAKRLRPLWSHRCGRLTIAVMTQVQRTPARSKQRPDQRSTGQWKL